MLTKKLLCLFVICLFVVSASFALAESEIPNLVGAWKVTSEGAVLIKAGKTSGKTNARSEFRNLNAELVVEKQKGSAFYGYFKRPQKTEKLVGVIGHDNKTAHWAGRNGFGQATIVSSDKMGVVYLQTSSAGSEAWVETLVKQ
jgi:hypothetical protein